MDPASNRNNSLAKLKFHRVNSAPGNVLNTSSLPSKVSIDISSSKPVVMPPAQSRDATQSSRFFAPTTPLKTATVLVPNSSPIPEPMPLYRPPIAQSTSQPFYPGPRPIGKNAQPSLYRFNHNLHHDPLSASTEFLDAPSERSGSLSSSSLRAIPIAASSKPSPTRHDSYDTQGSPQIRRPGKRRRLNAIQSDEDSSDHDESYAGSSNGRLVRGTRPSADKKEFEPVLLTKLRISNPTSSRERVDGAWKQCNGDYNAAFGLLSDPAYTPALSTEVVLQRVKRLKEDATPADVEAAYRQCNGDIDATVLLLFEQHSQPPPPSQTPSSSMSISPMRKEIAHARERDARKKAEKEATDAKRKQSAIYARRSTLNEVGSSATTAIDIPSSPPSPPAPPLRRPTHRVKKMVIDSGSEFDAESSDNDNRLSPETQARDDDYYQIQALSWFNDINLDTLMELSGCTREQAEVIASIRPFESVDDLRTKLHQGKRKAGPAGISPNLFDECVTIFKGYRTVDDVLDRCEAIGSGLKKIVNTWTSSKSSTQEAASEDGVIDLTDLSLVIAEGFLRRQPTSLSDKVTLKEYQLIGLNWLKLLHSKRYSCILADEMGLGKTVQVISFLAYLKESGHSAGKGPHLIVVPASTLENWCREFDRFAPSLKYQAYYASKDERYELRDTLKSTMGSIHANGWEVLITTYTLVQGDESDRKFFRKIPWEACIFDEGHVLKNFQSQRYTSLMVIRSAWRLLLTGTPLQNNLQELVSLMNFILPQLFAPAIDELRSVFKVKADSAASLLSRERVTRAKKMMTPFVLRRRKDQVLKELPKKVERIEWCEMTDLQRTIYREALQRSRKLLSNATSATATPDTLSPAEDSNTEILIKAKGAKGKKLQAPKDTSSNVLMDLRKASSHPMLFRRRFSDQTLTAMARLLIKQPDFVKRGALFDFVKEDMEVMTDSELQVFCDQYKVTQQFILDPECYLDAGKITVLMSLLQSYGDQHRRVLIFSQFTQILDILRPLLNQYAIKFLILTGSTPVDVRQSLVDEFNEDDSIQVFLLSTKAGGMGINLTAASVVILFDQDFNPHNDKQAADRAYRIGQTRDVEVIKLVTRGTIEEDMLRLAQTKLALDEAVAGDDGDSKAEKIMKESLMSTLRRQFVDNEVGT